MTTAGLQAYRDKRDFGRTPEPDGVDAPGRSDALFIVQKHAARRLHYDFRLAVDGVLKSWAVTRGPSRDPADKRLAVRTEDHPLAYADFEGTIPKGAYGAGTVMLWDRGGVRFEGDPRQGLADGKLKFTLDGERLRGGYALVRMRGRVKEKRENWLLIKERDEAVDPDFDLGAQDASVATGRGMAQIAAGEPARSGRRSTGAPASRPPPEHRLPKRRSATRQASKDDAAALPAFVGPQLATLVDAVPPGDGWLYELKLDGYRLLIAAAGSAVRCRTRNGKDWTDRFAPIADAVAALDLPPCLIDGEAVVIDDRGRTDFGALQTALKGAPERISYYAFDLLSLAGEDLRDLAQEKRQARLAELLAGVQPPLRLSTSVAGDGARIAAEACRVGAEGIMAKRADAPYRSRRTRTWLKIKCVQRQEFVIGGWSPSTRARPFSSLLLGQWDKGELHYAGRVGSGFDERELERIARRLRGLERKTAPFAAVPAAIRRSAQWVTPDLVAEVRYTEITRDGAVRHAVFEGLRDDKEARQVSRERKVAVTAIPDDGATAVAGVRLTHPDRVLYPSMGLTKRDLALYLSAVADAMLPHLAGRPISLVRCPEGRDGECFFQKHRGAGLGDAVATVAVEEKTGTVRDYIAIDDVAGLVACAQMAALEFHVWGSRTDRIDRPDRLVFDLDPGPGVAFAAVRSAAFDIAALLREGCIDCYPMLTGGKGIHLVAPLERRRDWTDVGGFARDFARKLADLDPQRFVAVSTKARRNNRIYVDYLRNRRGATAIAPFSPRAREGAPVAVPVSWPELRTIDAAGAYSVAATAAGLKARVAAWKGYESLRQSLTVAGAGQLGIALGGD